MRLAEVVCRCADANEGDEINVPDTDSGEESLASVEATLTTNIEAKIIYSLANLPQVITTCVVSSFTEKQLHPDKQGLIPTILVDENHFRL